MKTTSLISALLIGSALVAAPAFAKIPVSKGEKLCETAAETANPGAKSVRAVGDQTKVGDNTISYVIKVKAADDSSVKLTCKVDRATEATTLSPAS